MASPNTSAVKIPDDPVTFPLASALMIFTSVGGLAGNIFLCHLISTTQTLRTHINAYAINMAVADLLFGAILTPLRIVAFAIDPVLHSHVIFALCRTCVFLRTLVDAVRLMILSGLGYERYQAVAHPFNRDPVAAVRRLKVVTALFWAFSLASASVAAAFFADSTLLYHCHPDGNYVSWGDLDVYVILPVTLVGIALISVCYALIIKILIRHSDTMRRYFSRKNAVVPAEKLPSRTPLTSFPGSLEQKIQTDGNTMCVPDRSGRKAKSTGVILDSGVQSVLKQQNQDLKVTKTGKGVIDNSLHVQENEGLSKINASHVTASTADTDKEKEEKTSHQNVEQTVSGVSPVEEKNVNSSDERDTATDETYSSSTDHQAPAPDREMKKSVPAVATRIHVIEAADTARVSNTTEGDAENSSARNSQELPVATGERPVGAATADSTGSRTSAVNTTSSSLPSANADKTTSGQRIEVVEMDGSAHSETVAMSDAKVVGAVCKFDSKNREKGKRRVEVRAAKRIAIFTGVFVCLAMPFKITVILARHKVDFAQPSGVWTNLVLCFAAVETFTMILDPLLYCLINKPVKAAAGRKIRGWFRRR